MFSKPFCWKINSNDILFSNDKDQEQLRIWYENNEKALAVMQEASQELLSRGLIVDPQIFHSAVQHQTLNALGEKH